MTLAILGGAFCDIIKGKLQPDYRWISRDEFFRLKDTDPIVKIVWSFGNNGRNYLYGKDREELKKAMHYAVVFGDYSMSDSQGINLHSLDQYDTLEERYRAYKQLCALTFSKDDKTPPPPISLSGGCSAKLQSLQATSRIRAIPVQLIQKKIFEIATHRADMANVERLALLAKMGGANWAA